MYYKDFLTKIAQAKKYDQDEELKLIKEYQMTHNPMILGKLERIYRGTIQAAINSSQTVGLPQASLSTKALVPFKKAIETYSPAKGMKPSSHITQTIKWDLGKESREYRNSSRQRDSLTQTSQDKFNAESKLDLLGQPKTYENIQKTIQEMNSKNKFVDLKDLKRIDDTTRKDYLGGMSFGGEDGENLTYEDVYNTQTGADAILEKQLVSEKFHIGLSQLTPLERDVLKDRHGGLGTVPTGKKPENKWDLIALNNNLRSSYMAKKVYESAKEKLKQFMEEEE